MQGVGFWPGWFEGLVESALHTLLLAPILPPPPVSLLNMALVVVALAMLVGFGVLYYKRKRRALACIGTALCIVSILAGVSLELKMLLRGHTALVLLDMWSPAFLVLFVLQGILLVICLCGKKPQHKHPEDE